MLDLIIPLLMYAALSFAAVMFATFLVVRSGRLEGLDPDNWLVRLSSREANRAHGKPIKPENLELAADVHRLLLESIVLGRGVPLSTHRYLKCRVPQAWVQGATQERYAIRSLGPSVHTEVAFNKLLRHSNRNMLPKNGQHVLSFA